MNTIGERVKKKREERGWSQSELGRRMVADGWSKYGQVAVSRTEEGTRTPRLDESVSMAQVLGVALTWLATGVTDSVADTYFDGYDAGRDAGLVAAADAVMKLSRGGNHVAHVQS